MRNKKFIKFSVFISLLLSIFLESQSLENIPLMDEDFINSLPEAVREDVMSEMQDNSDSKKRNIQQRPSTEISKLETIKSWENFKKQQAIENESERYGLKLFRTMQSSFMPLNEPNFGNNYIVDYGDSINIELFGTENSSFVAEVKRDGTIALEDIGSVQVAGLNFEQVTDLIKKKYKTSFIGVEASVSFAEIRDINILITGNVPFPGIYTLSGNSNILQAINMVGGISENGTLRNLTLKRNNQEDQYIDLYQALLFGDIKNIPFLMSGDSIHIGPAANLIRAGYGFNNLSIFELKNNETISDLIKFSGGLKSESMSNKLKLVRFKDNKFVSYEVSSEDFLSFTVNDLDSVYADKVAIGSISLTGNVKHPGKYSISSSDKLLDIIKRAGGYTDSAYPFGGSLIRKSTKELELLFANKAYKNLITFLASSGSSITTSSSGTQGLGYILGELKEYKPSGRVVVEFDEIKLQDSIEENIYLHDGDQIHIPSYSSSIYILGEVGNPGSIPFKDGASILDYLNKSGGLTNYSSKNSIFVVHPNGETTKVHSTGLRKYLSQDVDVYPGSVIYVPRHVGKIEGINYYATIAPIFSSLALSIASLNSISN
jgi:protein involved in polysaccharide export with SLBB domain